MSHSPRSCWRKPPAICPNAVKGQWGEVNLRRILEFVGLIAYCDFDEQVHVGPDRELSRCAAGH